MTSTGATLKRSLLALKPRVQHQAFGGFQEPLWDWIEIMNHPNMGRLYFSVQFRPAHSGAECSDWPAAG